MGSTQLHGEKSVHVSHATICDVLCEMKADVFCREVAAASRGNGGIVKKGDGWGKSIDW